MIRFFADEGPDITNGKAEITFPPIEPGWSDWSIVHCYPMGGKWFILFSSRPKIDV